MKRNVTNILILAGIIIVGFSTGTVIAQEVEIGETGGTPEITFKDASASGETVIRLNDGTNQFQIFDVMNSRSSMIILDNGNIGLGDETNPPQDFSVGCVGTESCNLQTKAADGGALNVIRSVSGGDAKLRLIDNQVTGSASGDIRVEFTTRDDGTVCFKRQGPGGPHPCFLTFDMTGGANDLKIYDKTGTCVINC